MPETIELVHEELMPQLEGKKITGSIKARLMTLKRTVDQYNRSVDNNSPNESLKRSAQNQSAILHQEISDFLTSDLPDEEDTPINQNTMPTKEEQEHADRAAKVGLAATATVAEIEAKEKELSDAKELAGRAKKAGLPETATLAEIEAKEKEVSDAEALAERAKKAGLPATATLAEIEAKEAEGSGTGTGKKEEKKEEKKDKKKEVSLDPFDTLTGG